MQKGRLVDFQLGALFVIRRFEMHAFDHFQLEVIRSASKSTVAQNLLIAIEDATQAGESPTISDILRETGHSQQGLRAWQEKFLNARIIKLNGRKTASNGKQARTLVITDAALFAAFHNAVRGIRQDDIRATMPGLQEVTPPTSCSGKCPFTAAIRAFLDVMEGNCNCGS